MKRVDIKTAAGQLEELADDALRGEEVFISRGDGAQVKLVPVLVGEPKPTFGSAKGLVEIADDFDEPLTDFRAYMGR